MKLVELITTPDCQHIYQRYFKIVFNPKPPHQITSKEIFQEIVSYYNEDYHNVLNILCYEEINFLKNFDIKRNYRKDKNIITSLINKCLLIKNPQNDDYLEIPEDLKDSIIYALSKANCNKVNKIDQINELIIGILAVRGIIEPQELADIYLQYDSSLSDQEIIKHLNTNHYLFQHYFIYQGKDELLMAYEPYHPIIQEIEQLQIINKKLTLTYTAKQLKTIGKYGFDINDPVIAQLCTTLEKLDNLFFKELLRDSITLYCQIHGNINDLLQQIKELKISDVKTINYLSDCIKTAVPLIHSAAFYGLSADEYYLLVNQTSFFNEQESAIFYRLYLSVLQYTNQIFKVTAYSIKDLDYVELRDFAQVRELLFDNPKIIDQYLQTNPDHFTSYELDIIKGFKSAFIDKFLILKNYDDYTLVSNKNAVYAIYGLVNHLKEIYPNNTLPQICTLVLLPYKHKIVFDGLLEDGQSFLISDQIRSYQPDDIVYELSNNLLN